jgi:hypothetical protein
MAIGGHHGFRHTARHLWPLFDTKSFDQMMARLGHKTLDIHLNDKIIDYMTH